MYRSTTQDDSTEYDLIREYEHIDRIWAVIEKKMDHYYSFFEQAVDQNVIANISDKFKVKPLKNKQENVIKKYQEEIDDFEKKRIPYQKFFSIDDIDENLDDIKSFRTVLKKDCPIIRYLTSSKREDLHEWQVRYVCTKPEELFGISRNLITFSDEYVHVNTDKKFNKINRWEDFKTDKLQEDEDYRVEGVIGIGIKSIILYYLHPEYFPMCTRINLYALYFLSDQLFYNLPSRTSEFLMINDLKENDKRNYSMDHNYFYPYPLLSLYSLRIFRYLHNKAKAAGFNLLPEYRFIYVNAFLRSICDIHQETIDTMVRADDGEGL